MRGLPPLERAMRRSRIYRGRVGRMIVSGGLKRPCVFMHVPKCGGTSLSEALYALVPLSRKIGILDSVSIRRALALRHDGVDDRRLYHDEGDNAAVTADFRETLLLMHLAHACDLVHGHFLFSARAFERFGETYGFVTVLRDPVERTVSNYRMARRNGVFEGDLDAFLDSAMGRRMSQHALRYFSGIVDVAPGEEDAALARAAANMDRFAVIGFLDALGDFADAFHAIFGARPRIGHYNQGEKEPLDLTRAQRTRLETLCGPDIALTDRARRIAAGGRPAPASPRHAAEPASAA